VDDLVEGFVRMMNRNGFHGPVNLGNPGEFTMIELARKIIKITGSKSRLIHKPLPADDPRQRKPDISLAKKKLRWGPTVDLDEGLEKTVDYFRKVVA
jgi:UDP-glucuronate decarboxylase